VLSGGGKTVVQGVLHCQAAQRNKYRDQMPAQSYVVQKIVIKHNSCTIGCAEVGLLIIPLPLSFHNLLSNAS